MSASAANHQTGYSQPKRNLAVAPQRDRPHSEYREYDSKQKGKLRGKIVLIEPPPNPALPTKSLAERYDDAKLEILAQGPEPEPLPPLEWPLQRLPADREERDKVTDSIPQEVTV